jgi:uncharacterized lipoprotein NlpE involved in copper resistance
MKKVFFLMSIILSCFGCTNRQAAFKEFDYKVDRFADMEIIRYQVPGFEDLSLRQKKLVYYLSGNILTLCVCIGLILTPCVCCQQAQHQQRKYAFHKFDIFCKYNKSRSKTLLDLIYRPVFKKIVLLPGITC